MKLVRFSFFILGTSINKITDYETLEEVQADDLVIVVDKYLDEIKQSLGLDLKELAKPNNYLDFCTFVELNHNAENNEITEKNRLKIK